MGSIGANRGSAGTSNTITIREAMERQAEADESML